ncbi:hypothetical protein HXX76_013411 [Chlamydomonas incerta]|uniref:Uncharacterized protein n=1 Tax=Chlamydomonas incerta TaxID=51695 RepID=A0A835VUL9_CHLIN|nr:hypothetical protein HXX76_013411 [Chlamydomonas incerta]|eukprot:KAG2425786.1 hypothetical protein HXX76_013411 [Chlamydomonas incerta]
MGSATAAVSGVSFADNTASWISLRTASIAVRTAVPASAFLHLIQSAAPADVQLTVADVAFSNSSGSHGMSVLRVQDVNDKATVTALALTHATFTRQTSGASALLLVGLRQATVAGLTVEGSKCTLNSAGGQRYLSAGSCVCIGVEEDEDRTSSVDLTDVAVLNNTAQNSAALFVTTYYQVMPRLSATVTAGRMSVSGLRVEDQTSTMLATAASFSYLTSVSITGATIARNLAGGGLLIEGAASEQAADVTVSGVTFTGNSRQLQTDAQGRAQSSLSRGGALYITNAVSVSLTDLTFYDNVAELSGGAAIFESIGSLTISNVTAGNNTVSRSTAAEGADGGAFFISGVSGLTMFSGGRFTRNSAGRNGGALAIQESGQLSLTGIAFDSNEAGGSGGAVALQQLTGDDDSSEFVASNFTSNTARVSLQQDSATITAPTTGGGGAIAAADVSNGLRLRNCVLDGNSAPRAAGGAVNIQTSRYLVVTYTNATRNSAGTNGGAIFISNMASETSSWLPQNRFEQNTAGIATSGNSGLGGMGGAIYAETSTLATTCSAFIGNVAIKGGAIYSRLQARIALLGEQDLPDCQPRATLAAVPRATPASGPTLYPPQGLTAAAEAVSYGSVFANNAALSGGAVFAQDSTVWVFENPEPKWYTYGRKGVLFANNTASSGGALLAYSALGVTVRADFYDNAADAAAASAAVAARLGVPAASLAAATEPGAGGALAIIGSEQSSLTLRESAFVGNTAVDGAGLYLAASEGCSKPASCYLASVQGVVMQRNTARGGGGGGVFWEYPGLLAMACAAPADLAPPPSPVDDGSGGVGSGSGFVDSSGGGGFVDPGFGGDAGGSGGAAPPTQPAPLAPPSPFPPPPPSPPPQPYPPSPPLPPPPPEYHRAPPVALPDAQLRACDSWAGNAAQGDGYGPDVASTGFGLEAAPHYLDFYTSSAPIETNLSVLDYYGQRVSGGNRSVVIRAVSVQVFGQTYMVSDGGLAQFDDLKLRAAAGWHDVDFAADTGYRQLAASGLSVYVRPCTIGEYLSPTLDQCLACSPGYYNFNHTANLCNACDTQAALCSDPTYPGMIIPQDGYWHSNFFSEQVMDCPNGDACTYDNRTQALSAIQQHVMALALAIQESLVTRPNASSPSPPPAPSGSGSPPTAAAAGDAAAGASSTDGSSSGSSGSISQRVLLQERYQELRRMAGDIVASLELGSGGRGLPRLSASSASGSSASSSSSRAVALRVGAASVGSSSSGSRAADVQRWRAELGAAAVEHPLLPVPLLALRRAMRELLAAAEGGTGSGGGGNVYGPASDDEDYSLLLQAVSVLYHNYTAAMCAPGYVGVLCGSCDVGYGSTGPATCRLCPSVAANAVYYTMAIMLTMVILAWTIRSLLTQSMIAANRARNKRKWEVMGEMRLLGRPVLDAQLMAVLDDDELPDMGPPAAPIYGRALPADLAGGLAQLRMAYRGGAFNDDGSGHNAAGGPYGGPYPGGGGGGGYHDSGYPSEHAAAMAHAHSTLSAAGSAPLRMTASNHPSYSYSGWGGPGPSALAGAFSATNMTTYAGLQQQMQMQQSALSQQQQQQRGPPHQRHSLPSQQHPLSHSQSQLPLVAQASAPLGADRPGGLPPLPPGRGWSLRRGQGSATIAPLAAGGGAAAVGFGNSTSGNNSPAAGGGRHFSGTHFPNPLASGGASGAPASGSPAAAAGPHYSPFASYQAGGGGGGGGGAVASARSTALLSSGGGGADGDVDASVLAVSSSAATAAAAGLLTMPSRGASSGVGLGLGLDGSPRTLSAAIPLSTATGEAAQELLAAVDEEEQLSGSQGSSHDTQVYGAPPAAGAAPAAGVPSAGARSGGVPSAGIAGLGVGVGGGVAMGVSSGVLMYRVSGGSTHELEAGGEPRRTSLAGPTVHRLARSRGPSRNGVAEDRDSSARQPRLPPPAPPLPTQQHKEAGVEGGGEAHGQQDGQEQGQQQQEGGGGEGEGAVGTDPRDSAQDRPGHATALEGAKAALKEAAGKSCGGGGGGAAGGASSDRHHAHDGDDEQQQQQQLPQSYPAAAAGYGPEPPYLRPRGSVPYPAGAVPPAPVVPAPRAARARRASAGVYGRCGSPFGLPPPGFPYPYAYPQSPGGGSGGAGNPYYPAVMAAGGGFGGPGGGAAAAGAANAAHVSMAEALLSPRMASATGGVRRHPFFGGVDREGNDVITNVVPRAAGSFLVTNRRGSLLNLMAAAFTGGGAGGAAAATPPPAPHITPVGRFAAGAYAPMAAGASPVVLGGAGGSGSGGGAGPGAGGSLVVSPRVASATGMPPAFLAEVMRRRTREDARRTSRAARSGSGTCNAGGEPTPGALVLEGAAGAGVSGTAAGLVAALNAGRKSVTSLGAVLRKRLAGAGPLSGGGASSGGGSGGPNSAEIAASRAASGSRGLPFSPGGLGSGGPAVASGPGGISGGGGGPLSGSIMYGLGLEGAGVVDEFGVDDDDFYYYYGMSSGSPWSGAMHTQQQQQMQGQGQGQQQFAGPMQAFGISGGGGGGGMPPPGYPTAGGGGGGGYGEWRDSAGTVGGGGGGGYRDSVPHHSNPGERGKAVNSIAANPEPKPLQDAAVIKIFISYVQILALTRAVPIPNLPRALLGYMRFYDQITAIPGSLVSLDCSLPDATGVPKAMQRIILAALAPLYVSVVVGLVWVGLMLPVYRAERRAALRAADVPTLRSVARRYLPPRLLMSFATVMFYFYPNTVRALLSIFSCVGVDDGYTDNELAVAAGLHPGKYWTLDYDIRCYVGQHLALAIGLGVTGLLLLAVGWPLGVALWLYDRAGRRDQQLDFSDFSLVVYSSYRELYLLKYLYWESVIMLRQLCVAVVVVLLAQKGVAVQMLVVIAVVAGALVLQLIVQPFKTPTMNRLEETSLVVIIVTIYLNLYYISPAISQASRVALGIVIVLLNAAMLAVFVYFITRTAWDKQLDKMGLDRRRVYEMEAGEIQASLRRKYGRRTAALLTRAVTFAQRFRSVKAQLKHTGSTMRQQLAQLPLRALTGRRAKADSAKSLDPANGDGKATDAKDGLEAAAGAETQARGGAEPHGGKDRAGSGSDGGYESGGMDKGTAGGAAVKDRDSAAAADGRVRNVEAVAAGRTGGDSSRRAAIGAAAELDRQPQVAMELEEA